jgi:hypothetical protein
LFTCGHPAEGLWASARLVRDSASWARDSGGRTRALRTCRVCAESIQEAATTAQGLALPVF